MVFSCLFIGFHSVLLAFHWLPTHLAGSATSRAPPPGCRPGRCPGSPKGVCDPRGPGRPNPTVPSGPTRNLKEDPKVAERVFYDILWVFLGFMCFLCVLWVLLRFMMVSYLMLFECNIIVNVSSIEHIGVVLQIWLSGDLEGDECVCKNELQSLPWLP